MNEGDKISEKIKKLEKKFVGPKLWSPGPKNLQNFCGPYNKNIVLFRLQIFFCDTSSLHKFTDRNFVIESFFVELWPKTEFAQICPNVWTIFLQLKKSYFSEQILFLLTFPEKFEKIAVKVYNTYIKLIKA